MDSECFKSGGEIMILTCSGASNVGQVANRAAVDLTREGWGKMFCLAGIGGHLSGFVQSARDVPRLVAVDGCCVGCAKAVLAHAEIPVGYYLAVTDLGIEKNKNLDLQKESVEQVKEALRQCFSSQATPSKATASQTCGSGCCS